jgi:teichoic acid ribitol-phosphate primase
MTWLRARLVRLGFAIGCRSSLRARVVLATAHAAEISGNLVAIRDALQRLHPEIPLVVLAHAPRRGWRGLAAAALAAFLSGWHLATARAFVVDDYFFPMYVIRPRPGTTRMQVWHACGAFKKFGYSVLDRAFGADPAAVAAYPIHTNYDVCLVSAARFAPSYAEAFRQPVERFVASLGIPRTDLFFDEARRVAAAAAVRARFGIPTNRRIILYAPTFRGARTTEARAPEDLDLAALEGDLGADHVILLRQHPFVQARGGSIPTEARAASAAGARGAPSGASRGTSFVIDVSEWPDINELMLVSDILVTDYSSAIFEFALLGRPMAFFAPDHAAYERERGFYLDWPADLPGPVLETTQDLATYLRTGAFDLERVGRFAAASFDVADGQASRRCVEEVVLPALR